MKQILIFIIVVLSIPIPCFGGGRTTSDNKYVQVSFSLRERQLRAGSNGLLLINLQPKKGIHVNLEPPPSVTFDTTDVLSAAGKLDVPKSEKTKFLDGSRAMKQPFTLSRKLKPGPVTLTGSLTYFYCSDAEGWCSRFKQPVELTINVMK